MLRYSDINEALPSLMKSVLNGEEVGSRNGRTKELTFQHIELTDPLHRENLLASRRSFLPAQIAETMWVLSGRDDVAWLRQYLPRAKDFSDDGDRWRGAYGRRIRAWGGQYEDSGGSFDQLEYVVRLLQEDPATRRAVIAIYDPATDSQPGKDIPCNNWLHFLSRNGALDLHVAIRSNDLMWGWSGINAFEWSVLLECVAKMTSQTVGKIHFSISSLHLYQEHWSRAERISRDKPLPYVTESPRFSCTGIAAFDDLVREWFEIENDIRLFRERDTVPARIAAFPDPMLQSWLYVLGWWWTKESQYLEPIVGTPLYTAAILSPPRQPEILMPSGNVTFTSDLTIGGVQIYPQEPFYIPTENVNITLTEHDPVRDILQRRRKEKEVAPIPFWEFVANLHDEKNAVYGDSWKKRGEEGILANIARKVDRLGVEGAGDTSADTAIDFLVYLVKYRDWLCEIRGAYISHWQGRTGDHAKRIRGSLEGLSSQEYPDRKEVEFYIVRCKSLFEGLLQLVAELDFSGTINHVNTMTHFAYQLAEELWETERK